MDTEFIIQLLMLATADGLGSLQVVVSQTKDPPPSNFVHSQKMSTTAHWQEGMAMQ